MNTNAMTQAIEDIRQAHNLPEEALDSERVCRLVSLVGLGVADANVFKSDFGAPVVIAKRGLMFNLKWEGAFRRARDGFYEFIENIANGGDWWAFDDHRRSSKFDEKARDRRRAYDRAREAIRRKASVVK